MTNARILGIVCSHMSDAPSTRKPPSRRLTPKQERFIVEYAKDFNATQAAIRAGYKGKHVGQTAFQVLEKTRSLIEERRQASLKEAESTMPAVQRQALAIATLEQSLQLATALAFYDPRKLYEGDQIKGMDKLTRKQALMISDFKLVENFVKVGEQAAHVGYTKDVKLVDRAPYLNMLLKWHRAFADKQPAKGPDAVDDLSHWTAEDFEAYKKLKAKLRPTVIDGHAS